MSVPPIPSLSASQLARLGALGEERTAAVGEVLYRVGDTVYPFIAILEGEVAIVDADGNEIVRHGASSFLGELNLLSGQTVFVNAVVTKPLRYIAVERDALRALLFDEVRSAISSSPRSSPGERRSNASKESASRSSDRTVPRRRCGCSSSLARTGSHSAGRDDQPGERSGAPTRSAARRDRAAAPIARRGAARARGRLELAPREEVDLLVVGAGPGRPRRRGLRCVRGARHAGGREHRAGRPGRIVAPDRELSASRPDQRHRADQSRRHARRESSAHDTATPYRAAGARTRERTTHRTTRRRQGDRRARRRARDRRRTDGSPSTELAEYEGVSGFYAAGPPEAQLCGASRVAVVGGGNSAGQAAVWLARGGALVTLLHRRADLRETMSDYLIHELDRYGVAVRDRSEIAALHGERRAARGGHTQERRAAAVLVPLPLPRRAAVHRMARRRRRARRRRLHPHRRRGDADNLLETERSRHLRGRRRPLRLDQTLRHRRRRRSNGGPVRPAHILRARLLESA